MAKIANAGIWQGLSTGAKGASAVRRADTAPATSRRFSGGLNRIYERGGYRSHSELRRQAGLTASLSSFDTPTRYAAAEPGGRPSRRFRVLILPGLIAL
ncbi:MAG TPA: hypothetical protein VIZ17_18190, partial [Acetobacteraceae bacterium]